MTEFTVIAISTDQNFTRQQQFSYQLIQRQQHIYQHRRKTKKFSKQDNRNYAVTSSLNFGLGFEDLREQQKKFHHEQCRLYL